jgi:hypothetical protein
MSANELVIDDDHVYIKTSRVLRQQTEVYLDYQFENGFSRRVIEPNNNFWFDMTLTTRGR